VKKVRNRTTIQWVAHPRLHLSGGLFGAFRLGEFARPSVELFLQIGGRGTAITHSGRLLPALSRRWLLAASPSRQRAQPAPPP
jgi:hypothetical protein